METSETKVFASVLPVGQSVQPDLNRPVRPVAYIQVGWLPPPMPGKVLFGAMPDRRLRFRRPVPLQVYEEDGSIIARSPELDEFGCGTSVADALQDIGKTLAEEYVFLHEQADQLGEALRDQYCRLSEFVEYRPRQ